MQKQRGLGRYLLGFCLALSLSACGTYASRPIGLRSYPSPGDDQGVICVARVDANGAGQSVPVWDNDVLVGANGPGCHFCYPAAPGVHVLHSENYVTAELRIKVLPGERTVIKQGVDASSFPREQGNDNSALDGMEWVTLDTARADEAAVIMGRSQQCALSEVPLGERLPLGGRIRAQR